MRYYWLVFLVFCFASVRAQFVKNSGLAITNSAAVTVNGDWDNQNGSFVNNGTVTLSDNWTSTGGYSQLGAGGFVLTNTVTKQFNHAKQFVATLTKNGAGITQINDRLIIKTSLTLTNGLLSFTGVNDTLVMQTNAVATATPTSYVVGKVTRYGNGDLFFPVSRASNYLPITIFQVAGTNPRVTVSVEDKPGGYTAGANVSALTTFPYVWRSATLRGDTATYVEVQYPTSLSTPAASIVARGVTGSKYASMGMQTIDATGGNTKIKSYSRGLKGLFTVAVGPLLTLDTPVPAAASAISHLGFTANWGAVNNATGYRLDVSSDNFATFLTGYQDLAVATPGIAITGLTALATYQYRVRATGTAPTSPTSIVTSVTLLAVPPPVATAATAITAIGFTANWGGVAGATGYQLDVSADNFATNIVGFNNLVVTGTTSVVTGLTPNTPYKFRVRATSASPTSVNSNVIDVTTLPPPPTAPVATSASTVSQTGFTANWNAVTGATGYRLDVSADNFTTFVTGFNNKTVSGTSDAVTGLTISTAYKYRVRSVNANGTSVNSNVIDVTTLATPPPPDAPVATAATAISQTGFTANWNAVTGATGYRLDVSSNNFVSSIAGFSDKTVSGTSDVITGLAISTAYKYRVRAVNANGTSVNSNVIDVTTLGKQDQTITFPVITDKTVGDAPFALGATASSGLTVTYATGSDKITIANGIATIVKPGRETVEAAQPGNGTFNAAVTLARSFCIRPAKPTITLTNANTETPILTSSATAGNQWYRNGVAIANATNAALTVTTPGIYSVDVTIETCKSERSNDFAVIVTGDGTNRTNSGDELIIVPNPVKDRFLLKLPGTGHKKIAIFSASGGMVQSASTQQSEWQADATGYAAGFYTVRVISDRFVYYGKFIKE